MCNNENNVMCNDNSNNSNERNMTNDMKEIILNND